MNIYLSSDLSSHAAFLARLRKPISGCVFAMLLTCSVSCRQPGYRTEVMPGEQGSVQVRHVPYTPAETRSAYEPGNTMRAFEAASQPADPDLSQIQSAWPNVSPSDRKIVVDMVKRLAKPAP